MEHVGALVSPSFSSKRWRYLAQAWSHWPIGVCHSVTNGSDRSVRLGRLLSNGLQRTSKATLAMINDDTRRLSTRYRAKVARAQLRQQGMKDLSKGRDRTVNRIVKETKMGILASIYPTIYTSPRWL